MGREQSLPIFIGNDSGAQNDIYTWTWIVWHCTSWAGTPASPYIRNPVILSVAKYLRYHEKPYIKQATHFTVGRLLYKNEDKLLFVIGLVKVIQISVKNLLYTHYNLIDIHIE